MGALAIRPNSALFPKGRKTWLPEAWRELPLTPAQRQVAIALKHYRDYDTDVCAIAVDTLATYAKCCRRTVQRAMEAFERWGLLTPLPSARGVWAYRLHLQNLFGRVAEAIAEAAENVVDFVLEMVDSVRKMSPLKWAKCHPSIRNGISPTLLSPSVLPPLVSLDRRDDDDRQKNDPENPFLAKLRRRFMRRDDAIQPARPTDEDAAKEMVWRFDLRRKDRHPKKDADTRDAMYAELLVGIGVSPERMEQFCDAIVGKGGRHPFTLKAVYQWAIRENELGRSDFRAKRPSSLVPLGAVIANDYPRTVAQKREAWLAQERERIARELEFVEDSERIAAETQAARNAAATDTA